MATVIKSGQQRQNNHAPKSVAFNFDDMAVKAEEYLGKIRQQAGLIVSEAHEQARKIKEQASVDGRQQAIEQALQQVRQEARASRTDELETLRSALQQAIHIIQQARSEWRQQWEENVVRLAGAIAERILRHELEKQPTLSLNVVRESLELASGARQLRVRLNPNDCVALGDQIQAFVDEFSGLGAAEIVPDAEIERGGCLVQTEFGAIDQRVATQLARITEELI